MQFLSRILKILSQKERAGLFQFVFWDVLISALDIVFLGFTVLIINFYIKGSAVSYLSWLPGNLTNQNSITLIAVFFMLFGVKNALAYWLMSKKNSFIYDVASRLSEQGIRQYLKEDYIRFVNIDSAVQIRRISHQPIEFCQYILTNLQQVISQSMLVFFAICAILFYHASLFLLLLCLLMPAVVLLGWLMKHQLKNIRKHIKETSADTLKNLKEALNGYVESNIYEKDDFFADRYYRKQQQLNQYICTQQSLQYLPSRLIELFAIFGFLTLIAINKWSAHTPVVDLLTTSIFLAAAYKIIPGIVKIINSAGQMKTYEFTIDDLLKRAQPEYSETLSGTLTSISLEKVHFKYNGKPVLDGISMDVQRGDFVGIAGNSGRGKTTLLHILLGFIKADDGIVRVNQKITTAEESKRYRNRVSYIKQQPFLIHDTIKNNITLQDGDYDEARLSEVITFCGLDTLMDQHYEGYDLVITENGKNLSGGQRQRVMLARALYHDFDLLILDEPFGELDQKSESEILGRLKSLTNQGKMILYITHKQANFSCCNKVVSMDG